MTREQILIYVDKGADPFCIKALVHALQQELLKTSYSIKFTNHQLLQTSLCDRSTKLLIFPGGRDIPYHEALQGSGNEHIARFVQKGGAFLGICAGAYYGSASIEFEKGGPLEVVASRELRFFPGTAQGPAYGLGIFDYSHQQGARIASIEVNKDTYYSYYHGGCAFIGEEKNPNVLTLARYADIEKKPPAIVRCHVGLGVAILCGVHPEYSGYNESASKHLQTPLLLALREIENKRRMLFQRILQELGMI
jgi:biotin--protein ligase